MGYELKSVGTNNGFGNKTYLQVSDCFLRRQPVMYMGGRDWDL